MAAISPPALPVVAFGASEGRVLRAQQVVVPAVAVVALADGVSAVAALVGVAGVVGVLELHDGRV